MNIDRTLYVTTKEAAQILGKSRRTSHNILQDLIDKQNELKCEPSLHIKIKDNSIYHNYNRHYNGL